MRTRAVVQLLALGPAVEPFRTALLLLGRSTLGIRVRSWFLHTSTPLAKGLKAPPAALMEQ